MWATAVEFVILSEWDNDLSLAILQLLLLQFIFHKVYVIILRWEEI